MTMEKDLWVLHAGDQTRTSGKNKKAAHLITNMDEMAATVGGTLIIETDEEKVLAKAAEYATQKGYDLISPVPEQNLQIKAIQEKLAGEEIGEGELGPSLQKQRDVQPDPEEEKQKLLEALAADRQSLENFDHDMAYSEDPVSWKSELAESKRRHAELDAREAEYQEKGWLPKKAEPEAEVAVPGAAPAVVPEAPKKGFGVHAPEADPAQQGIDPVADIAQMAEQAKAQKNPFHDAELENQNPKKALAPAPMDFPEKRPAEVLATRFKVPTAKDHGNRLVITKMGMLAVYPPQFRKREELVTATLLKARERFGDPVRVTGNKAFENEVIKAAIAQGIPLEMGSDRGEKAYALALQGEQKYLAKTMGKLEPSKERAVEKAAPAKGVGRGLAL